MEYPANPLPVGGNGVMPIPIESSQIVGHDQSRYYYGLLRVKRVEFSPFLNAEAIPGTMQLEHPKAIPIIADSRWPKITLDGGNASQYFRRDSRGDFGPFKKA